MPVPETSSATARPMLLHQRRVAGRAEADVVREDGRTDDVVVAVHRVDAVDHRDAQRRGQRRVLEAVVHVRPGGGVVRRRGRATAGQDRAEPELGDLRIADRTTLGLGHLADLLVQAHPGQQVVHAGRRPASVGSWYGSPAAWAGSICSVPITTAVEASSRPAAAARESFGIDGRTGVSPVSCQAVRASLPGGSGVARDVGGGLPELGRGGRLSRTRRPRMGSGLVTVSGDWRGRNIVGQNRRGKRVRPSMSRCGGPRTFSRLPRSRTNLLVSRRCPPTRARSARGRSVPRALLDCVHRSCRRWP